MASGNKGACSDAINPMSRPPTASTALWSHLLRTSTTAEAPKSLKEMPIIVPPMAPLDKNATSMRILLHDTQANFEKFTSHVGKLLESIQETKNGLKTMQSYFQHDRENLMGDIVDLVNRSQREIQKSIGTPAQVDAVVALFKEVTHRLESLDQRLDAINMFNQTHSQALQTQMQSIQLVLDKQGSIISAVTPLLPLLQGLPPHIESTKTAVKEVIAKLSTTHRNLSLAPCLSGPTHSSSAPLPNKTTKKRKRSLDSQDSAPSSPSSTALPVVSRLSSQKRTRTQEELDHLPSGAHVRKSAKNQAYIPTVAASSSPSALPTILSSGNRLASLLKERRGKLTTECLTTPPRALSDLPALTLAPSSCLRPSITVDLPTDLASHPSSRTSPVFPHIPPVPKIPNRSITLTNTFGPIQQSDQVPLPAFLGTATRTPRMLRVHATLSADSRTNSVQSLSRERGPGASPRIGQSKIVTEANPIVNGLNPAMRTSTAGATRRTPAINRIANSNTRARTPLSQTFVPQQVVNDEAEDSLTRARGGPALLPSAAMKLKEKHLKNSVIYGKVKEPLKEGRRFIPLMDSDDEENS